MKQLSFSNRVYMNLSGSSSYPSMATCLLNEYYSFSLSNACSSNTLLAYELCIFLSYPYS